MAGLIACHTAAKGEEYDNIEVEVTVNADGMSDFTHHLHKAKSSPELPSVMASLNAVCCDGEEVHEDEPPSPASRMGCYVAALQAIARHNDHEAGQRAMLRRSRRVGSRLRQRAEKESLREYRFTQHPTGNSGATEVPSILSDEPAVLALLGDSDGDEEDNETIDGSVHEHVERVDEDIHARQSTPLILSEVAVKLPMSTEAERRDAPTERCRLKRLHHVLLDTGGAISAIDQKTAQEILAIGAAGSVVELPEGKQHKLRLAPVGGGPVSVVAEARFTICLRDAAKGTWHPFQLRMHVIKGPRLFLIGNTFNRPTRIVADVANSKAEITWDSARSLRMDVHVSTTRGVGQENAGINKLSTTGEEQTAAEPPDASPGGEPALEAARDTKVPSLKGESPPLNPEADPEGAPMMYTTDSETVEASNTQWIRVRVPLYLVGHDISPVNLMQKGADTELQFNIMRLLVDNDIYTVKPGGFVHIRVHNPTEIAVKLVAHTQTGYAMADPKVAKLRPSDMTIEEIVDALHIHESIKATDEEVAATKEMVKQMLGQNIHRWATFSKERIGRCHAGQFEAELKEEYANGSKAPPAEASRPVSAAQGTALKAIFDDIRGQGILVPTSSPFAAVPVMVKKPDNRGWRLAFDFRRTNESTIKQHYPLPNIKHVLEKMKKAKFFSAFDSNSAFWQIPTADCTMNITAVQFPWGRYAFTTMPMGLQQASATYQRIMDRILMGTSDFAVGYLDDIIAFSETWQQHLLDVAIILDRLGGAGLTLRPEKTFIGLPEIHALGHIVDAKGTRPDPKRLQPFLKMAFPEAIEELEHWVGLIRWFSSHIPDCALLLQPMQQRLNCKTTGTPSAEELKVFRKVNAILIDDGGIVLKRPDWEKPFQLQTDAASTVGAGALLMQTDDKDILAPVAYWSRCWVGSEKFWAPVIHEGAAVYKAICEFWRYLSSGPFTLVVDAEPLVWLRTVRKPSGKLAVWTLALQSLDFRIVHEVGCKHIGPDALSRLAHLMQPLEDTHLVGTGEVTARALQLQQQTQVATLTSRPEASSALPSTTTPEGDVLPMEERYGSARNSFKNSQRIQTHIQLLTKLLQPVALPSNVTGTPAFTWREDMAPCRRCGEPGHPHNACDPMVKPHTRRALSRQLDESAAREVKDTAVGVVIFNDDSILVTKASALPKHFKRRLNENKATAAASALVNAFYCTRGDATGFLLGHTSYFRVDRMHVRIVYAIIPSQRRIIERLFLNNGQKGCRWMPTGKTQRCRMANGHDEFMVQRVFELQEAWKTGTHSGTSIHPAFRRAAERMVYRSFTPTSMLANLRVDSRDLPTRELTTKTETIRALRRIQEVVEAARETGGCTEGAEKGTVIAFSVDLEYDMKCQWKYGRNMLALVQVAVGNLVFVFDPIAVPAMMQLSTLGGVPTMRHWLESDEIIIVSHAAGSDARILYSQFSIVMTRLFDTSIADAVAKLRSPHESRRLGKVMDDWVPNHGMIIKGTIPNMGKAGLFRERPLPSNLLEYAWQDVAWGEELYEAQRKVLAEQRNLGAVYAHGYLVSSRYVGAKKVGVSSLEALPVETLGLLITNGLEIIVHHRVMAETVCLAAGEGKGVSVAIKPITTTTFLRTPAPVDPNHHLGKVREWLIESFGCTKKHVMSRAVYRIKRVDNCMYYYVWVADLGQVFEEAPAALREELYTVATTGDRHPIHLSSQDTCILDIARHQLDLPEGGETAASDIYAHHTQSKALCKQASAAAKNETVVAGLAGSTTPACEHPAVTINPACKCGAIGHCCSDCKEQFYVGAQCTCDLNEHRVHAYSMPPPVPVGDLELGHGTQLSQIAALSSSYGMRLKPEKSTLAASDQTYLGAHRLAHAVTSALVKRQSESTEATQLGAVTTTSAYADFVQVDGEPVLAQDMASVAILIHDGNDMLTVGIGPRLQRDSRLGKSHMLPHGQNDKSGGVRNFYRAQQVFRQLLGRYSQDPAFGLEEAERNIHLEGALPPSTKCSAKMQSRIHCGIYVFDVSTWKYKNGDNLQLRDHGVSHFLRKAFDERQAPPTTLQNHAEWDMLSLEEAMSKVPAMDAYAIQAVMGGGPPLRPAICDRCVNIERYQRFGVDLLAKEPDVFMDEAWGLRNFIGALPTVPFAGTTGRCDASSHTDGDDDASDDGDGVFPEHLRRMEGTHVSTRMDACYDLDKQNLIPSVPRPGEFAARLFDHGPYQIDFQEAQSADDYCSAWLDHIAIGENDSITLDGKVCTPANTKLERSFFEIQEGILIRWVEVHDHQRAVPVVPTAYREGILAAVHGGVLHLGRDRMMSALTSKVWWPCMRESIDLFLRECETCCRNKPGLPHGDTYTPDNGIAPWHTVHVDKVHLEMTESGNDSAMIFCCRFTRDVMAFACTPYTDSERYLNMILFGVLPAHGLPACIVSDRGSILISKLVRRVFSILGMESVAIDANTHRGVGICERFNHTLREMARAAYHDHAIQWDTMLPLITFVYRSTMSKVTGHSAFYLNHGREARLPFASGKVAYELMSNSTHDYIQQQLPPLHTAWEVAKQHLLTTERKRRETHRSKYNTALTFKEQQLVLILQPGPLAKMELPTAGPFRVTDILDRGRYRLQLGKGDRRHPEFPTVQLRYFPRSADEALQEGDDYYDVETVLAVNGEDPDNVLYKVRWVGYGADHDSWVPLSSMGPNAKEEAFEFEREELKKEISPLEEHQEDDESSQEEMHEVDKVVGIKNGPDGTVLYRIRWLGFSKKDDTWEKLEQLGPEARLEALDYAIRDERERARLQAEESLKISLPAHSSPLDKGDKIINQNLEAKTVVEGVGGADGTNDRIITDHHPEVAGTDVGPEGAKNNKRNTTATSSPKGRILRSEKRRLPLPPAADLLRSSRSSTAAGKQGTELLSGIKALPTEEYQNSNFHSAN